MSSKGDRGSASGLLTAVRCITNPHRGQRAPPSADIMPRNCVVCGSCLCSAQLTCRCHGVLHLMHTQQRQCQHNCFGSLPASHGGTSSKPEQRSCGQKNRHPVGIKSNAAASANSSNACIHLPTMILCTQVLQAWSLLEVASACINDWLLVFATCSVRTQTSRGAHKLTEQYCRQLKG